MEEANPVKFYLVKYFFLANATLLALATFLLAVQFGDSPKNRSVAFILLALSFIFLSLHFLVAAKIQKVAVSKKKLTIIGQKPKSYEWAEVKEIKFLPFVNMYSVKLKKKRIVYFLPPNGTVSLFGLFSAEQEFIPKKASKA